MCSLLSFCLNKRAASLNNKVFVTPLLTRFAFARQGMAAPCALSLATSPLDNGIVPQGLVGHAGGAIEQVRLYRKTNQRVNSAATC